MTALAGLRCSEGRVLLLLFESKCNFYEGPEVALRTPTSFNLCSRMRSTLLAALVLLLAVLPLTGVAVIVRLDAGGAAHAVPPSPRPVPPRTAIVLGAAELLVPEAAAGNGLSLFLRSLDHAYASAPSPPATLPVLVLVLDAMTAAYARPLLEQARHYSYIIYSQPELYKTLPDSHRGPGWTVHSQRFLYYEAVLADIAAGGTLLAEAVVAASATFCAGDALDYAARIASGVCLPQPSAALMTDLRDVVLQGDAFAPLWALVEEEEEQGRQAQSPDAMPSILVVAQEWQPMPLRVSLFNANWLNGCFPAAAAAASSNGTGGLGWLSQLPILCSGTTLGTLPAISAYLAAMRASMPVCAGAVALRYGWDQAIHQAVVRLADGDAPPQGQPDHELGVIADILRLHGFGTSSSASSVRIFVAPAEGRWLCTLSFLSPALGAALWEPSGRVITGLGVPAAVGINIHAVATGAVDVSSLPGTRFYVGGPEEGRGTGGGACLVVHQYDRYPALKDAVNQLYG